MTPLTRASADVDLGAIRSNVLALRDHAGPAELMAVVKADGYGHGLVPAARAALAGGATWLGTALVEEALALRAAGISARVVTWIAAPGQEWDTAVAADVDVSAGAPWLVDELAAAARRVGRTARLHLEADTGLSRGGAGGDDWAALVRCALAAQADGAVELVGVWSHFACADEPGHPATARQLETFHEMLAQAHALGARPQVRHLANSAATLVVPQARFDLVRVGIALYGLSPAPALGPPERYGLRPAMTLRGRLAMVKRVRAGDGVSYGHTWTATSGTTLGLVPLGYADGVPRPASNRVEVMVGGRRAPSVGTVCMDQFMVDLAELDDLDVRAGDEVILFGPGDEGEPTAQEWADATGTIGYEIVTRVGARVPRTYRGLEGLS